MTAGTIIRPLLLSVLLAAAFSMSCGNISIGTTGYDLSHLNNLTSGSGYLFAFCNSFPVSSQNYLYSTLAAAQYTDANNQLQTMPLTPSTQPTSSAYSVSDGKLSIKFPSITYYQPTLNQTITTELRISCATATKFVSATPISITSPQLSMTIDVDSPAGCLFNLPNYLWQFLIDHKLVFALIVLVVGLFELFLGYFLIQITIFIYGWIAGAAFSLIYLAQTYPGNQQSPLSVINYMIILSALLGIFYGFLLITLPKLGYFNIGIWLGAILTLMLQNAVLYLSKSLLAFYIVLGVVCLILGIIAIMAFKYFIIVSTSLISGFMLVRPLGFYLDYYPNEFLFYLTTGSMPWQYYLYLISMLVLASIGIIFQTWLYHKTGKRRNKLYHLEEQGDFKEKLKKLLEFKDIKKAIASGKEQFTFLKNLIKKDEGGANLENSQVEQPEERRPDDRNKQPNRTSEYMRKQQRPSSDEEEKDSDGEEGVQIELVDLKGRRQPPSKPSSKQPSIPSRRPPSDDEQVSDNASEKKRPVKVVSRKKK